MAHTTESHYCWPLLARRQIHVPERVEPSGHLPARHLEGGVAGLLQWQLSWLSALLDDRCTRRVELAACTFALLCTLCPCFHTFTLCPRCPNCPSYLQVVQEPVQQWQEYRCRDIRGNEKTENVLEVRPDAVCSCVGVLVVWCIAAVLSGCCTAQWMLHR